MWRHFTKWGCKKDRQADNIEDMVITIFDDTAEKKLVGDKRTRFKCAYPNCPDHAKIWTNKHGVHKHWEAEHADSIVNPVLCTVCPRKLVTEFRLKVHMERKHYQLEGNVFTCSHCGITKESKWQLYAHEKTHQEDKESTLNYRISCEFCSYTTLKRKCLKSHQEYNHRDKLGLKEMRLRQCEQCGKEFKNIANLKAHVKSMHSTGPDVKYKCHICSKQLKQDNSYRKHMANAHGIGERCEQCNKLYKTKKVLELHIKRVHGLNSDDMSSGS